MVNPRRSQEAQDRQGVAARGETHHDGQAVDDDARYLPNPKPPAAERAR